MIKKFILLFTILLFNVCFTKGINKSLSFEQEDSLILKALYFNEIKKYKKSSDLFYDLYLRFKKYEYLKESLYLLLNLQDIDRVIFLVKKHLNEGNKKIFNNILIEAYLAKGKYNSAIKIALKSKDNKIDYNIMAYIYMRMYKYKEALEYLQSFYASNYDEVTLKFIVDILYNKLNKRKEAIAFLETHLRVIFFSENLANILLGFYSNDDDADGMISVYKRLYKNYKKDEYAKGLISTYFYKKDYKNIIKFLEENYEDDKTLLEIYIQEKMFYKASKLAYKIYKETRDYNYLAKSSILEFEQANRDKRTVRKLIKKLRIVNKNIKKALYLNYLGYLLIDFDIDIKEGISYVKQALDIEPKSAYYLDSLAWGYYKQKKCKKAKVLMLKVIKILGDKDEVIKTHINAINDCEKRLK